LQALLSIHLSFCHFSYAISVSLLASQHAARPPNLTSPRSCICYTCFAMLQPVHVQLLFVLVVRSPKVISFCFSGRNLSVFMELAHGFRRELQLVCEGQMRPFSVRTWVTLYFSRRPHGAQLATTVRTCADGSQLAGRVDCMCTVGSPGVCSHDKAIKLSLLEIHPSDVECGEGLPCRYGSADGILDTCRFAGRPVFIAPSLYSIFSEIRVQRTKADHGAD
jgi:hypothetical protein